MDDFFLILFGLTFGFGSLILALTSKEQQEKLEGRYPWVGPILVIAVFAGYIGLILGIFFWGDNKGGDFFSEMRLKDGSGGLHGFMINTVFKWAILLWLFWIPGHNYANGEKAKHGRRPKYPYIVGALFGLVITTQNNLIYKFMKFWWL